MSIRIIIVLLSLNLVTTIYSQTEIYELRVYEMEFFKPASVLHNYLENALIPALNRHGVKNVGAFEEESNALPKKIYLLIAYNNINAIGQIADALSTDKEYNSSAEPYHNAPQEKIPFTRISTSFIRSATGFPRLVKPHEDSELFELRIYESHNEDALRRKVKMFNESEFDIFAEVGLNTVFFGQNISGDQMPCLTYLLAFKDFSAHQEAWSKFGPHPEWQRITKLEEYANAMNNITRVFLKPLAYSQL